MTGRSARRRILLSRDTLLGLVAVLVLAAVCVVLGMWQFGRYEDRRDAAEVIRTNYDASPVALDEVIDGVGSQLIGVVPEDPEVTLFSSFGRMPDPRGELQRICKAVCQRLDGQYVPLMIH